MHYKKWIGILLLYGWLTPVSPLFAQQQPPTKTAPGTPAKATPGAAAKTTLAPAAKTTPAPGGFKLFFEKVYLHIDRDYYSSGDDIWFKAYLVNAQSDHPTNTSDNLYVELLDPHDSLVTREVIRLDHGMGAGDFKLADSIPDGRYRLRAYTNWMRNFGNHFIFEKDLTIHSTVPVGAASSAGQPATTASLAGPPATRSPTTRTNTPRPATYDIQFLPEGGYLVEGLPSDVAFKATDNNGRGILVKGALLSSKGDTLLHFQSIHRGMGMFHFTPDPGLTYQAVLVYPTGSPVIKPLPAAIPDGYTMSVTHDGPTLQVQIRAGTKRLSAHPDAELTLAGRHGGKVYYGEKVTLNNGQATLQIPDSTFPPGIACLTLYDETQHPHCERLTYIDDPDPITLTISTDRSTYQRREKVTVQITATDAKGQPVQTNLSLAAIDRGIINKDPGNIHSYLDLESELKGRVEEAAAYFDPVNPRRKEQLDLLLRAQGWRSFLWRSLADTSIRISYLPEPGITISGRVRQTGPDKPLPNMNITLYAGGAKGDKFRSVKTDSTGRYYIDGMELYGMQDIKINSKNDKGKKGGWLLMDTLFKDHLAVKTLAFALPDTSAVLPRFAAESDSRWAFTQKEPFHSVLPGVTVTNHAKPVTLRDGSAYMSFGYPEYNFTITPKDLAFETLANFLVHNVPGAVEDVEHEGVEFIAGGKPVRPRFVVDKKEDVFERIDYYTVHMDQVNSVSVRHLVGPPSFTKGQRDAAGRTDPGLSLRDIFLVYLSLKPGAYNNDLALINTEVRGYYEARNFYAPAHINNLEDVQPDVRTTLLWEPYISTNAEGRATVTFYNADPITSIGIDVEGLTGNGIPVTATGKYEITDKK